LVVAVVSTILIFYSVLPLWSRHTGAEVNV